MESDDLNELDYMDDATFADYLQEKSESWSWQQNKAFENALGTHLDESGGDQWERIAADVPGKDVEDVVRHYQALEEDIDAIDGDRVPLPIYSEDDLGDGGAHGKKGGDGKALRAEQERRKGIAWSEEEHRLFLLGLNKFGKGDWRSISRNYVITRTPTQVASHAQKYYIRMQSGTKDKRRSSIHDITSVQGGDSQGPITGQHSELVSVPGVTGKHQPPAGNPRIPSGPAIGHPVAGSHALGTPVVHPLPPNSVPPRMAYRMPAPAPYIVVPVPGVARENQMENVYPENQMEDAYTGNQEEKVHPENQKKNTKNTHPKEAP